MEMVSSVPVAHAASNDDDDDEPLLKKLCVFLCMPQNVPECASEHLKVPKLSWGTMPPDPPKVNNCRAAMFSTFTLPPPMGKVMYGPGMMISYTSKGRVFAT